MDFGSNFFNSFDFTTETNEERNSELNKRQKNNSFIDFTGSQDSFEQVISKFIYIEGDFRKATSFLTYIQEDYPDIVINEYKDIVQHLYLTTEVKAEGGITQYILKHAKSERSNIDSICNDIGQISSMCYITGVLFESLYQVNKFKYIYQSDLKKHSQLVDKWDELSEEWFSSDKNGTFEESREGRLLTKQMEALERKYQELGGELGDNCFYAESIVKHLDIEHIMSRSTDEALKYSTWLDELYTVFIDNAIQIHRISQLKQLYPSPQQKRASRQLIQKAMVSKLKEGFSNLPNVGRHINMCSSKCERIKQGKSSSKELTEKAGISLALGLINPVLTIGGLAHTAHSWYKNKQKSSEIKAELVSEIDTLFQELERVVDDVCVAQQDLSEYITNDIANKHLKNGILDILNKLKKNGINIESPEKYLH